MKIGTKSQRIKRHFRNNKDEYLYKLVHLIVAICLLLISSKEIFTGNNIAFEPFILFAMLFIYAVGALIYTIYEFYYLLKRATK